MDPETPGQRRWLIFAGLVVACVGAFGVGRSTAPAPAPVAVSAGPVEVVYVPAPRTDDPTEVDRVEWERTAQEFLRVWVVPAPVEERRRALAGFMTPEAVAKDAGRSHDRLPVGDVAGPPLHARVVGSGGIYLAKLTSGARVSVMGTRTPDGWRVYDVQG